MNPELQIFHFEQDFADALRCIPMSVRMNLDLCGIKLSLRQWSRFSHHDRYELCYRPIKSNADRKLYRQFLAELIRLRAHEEPVYLSQAPSTEWKNDQSVPDCLQIQIAEKELPYIHPERWTALTSIQRFALVKLCRSGHENHNLLPALKEFGF